MEVAIITNMVTSYREGFYDRLFIRDDISVTVYCAENIPGTNLKSIHDKYAGRVRVIKALTAKGEKIGFQFLPFWTIFNDSDVIFLDGNPRILSNWLMSFFSIFSFNKRIVMWTMAHSFGANRFTENVRLLWTSFHKNIFVYTDKEVLHLRNKGWSKQNIIGMNNGLDQKVIDLERSKWSELELENWRKEKGLNNCTSLLSIARLVPKNKFPLMIEALPLVLKKIPNLKWIIIGEGSEGNILKELVVKNDLIDFVKFEGPIYEERSLAPYFLTAKIFVHPASIGLSLMHAFGYGLPVVVDSEEYMHGPEYGAFKNFETGINFDKDDPKGLADAILGLLQTPSSLDTMSKRVVQIAREEYNVDIMVERFVQMCKTNN